jgi:hypothetical protein
VAAAGVQEWYLDHRAELGTMTVAWVALPADDSHALAVTGQLEADPLSAILTAHHDRRGGGLVEWRAADLQGGRLALADAKKDSAVRVDVGGPAVAVALDRRPAVLDEGTRDFVERRLFDEWLSERRRRARVEWFWGNDARTMRAAER